MERLTKDLEYYYIGKRTLYWTTHFYYRRKPHESLQKTTKYSRINWKSIIYVQVPTQTVYKIIFNKREARADDFETICYTEIRRTDGARQVYDRCKFTGSLPGYYIIHVAIIYRMNVVSYILLYYYI